MDEVNEKKMTEIIKIKNNKLNEKVLIEIFGMQIDSIQIKKKEFFFRSYHVEMTV